MPRLQFNPLIDVVSDDGTTRLGDFYAVLPTNQFMHLPTRELWSKDSVSSILPLVPAGYRRNGKEVMLKPATWLQKNRHAEQMTWAPGLPAVIEDRYILEGGWLDHAGARCLNTYRPPAPSNGDARQATPWRCGVCGKLQDFQIDTTPAEPR